MSQQIVDNLDEFLNIFPSVVFDLVPKDNKEDILEVILDYGRTPVVRYPTGNVILQGLNVSKEMIEEVVSHLGMFSDDNRAGIEGTLHRISAIRNRLGQIIGLTCRVGRFVPGAIEAIKDLITKEGISVLIIGAPSK